MSRVRLPDHALVRPDDVASDAVVSAFRVPTEVAGQRLDLFLQSQLRRTSRTRSQEIVRLSAYDATGKRLRPNYRVKADEHIVLWRAAWDEAPVPVDIPIVYEDDELLAVNKPAGLPVHPTARYHRNTLIRMLQDSRDDEFLSLGHRIDRETSGVLLLSKSRRCDRALKKQLEERRDVEKRYLALTWGLPASARVGEVLRCDAALELDPGGRYKVQMRVSTGPGALPSATRFTVLDVRRTAHKGDYARVQCDLETGRQHQIRVHLQSLGSPIVGDKLYGPDETCFARGADGELTARDLELLELPRHALHAHVLELAHPITGASLRIEAPPPDDLEDFWRALA